MEIKAIHSIKNVGNGTVDMMVTKEYKRMLRDGRVHVQTVDKRITRLKNGTWIWYFGKHDRTAFLSGEYAMEYEQMYQKALKEIDNERNVQPKDN